MFRITVILTQLRRRESDKIKREIAIRGGGGLFSLRLYKYFIILESKPCRPVVFWWRRECAGVVYVRTISLRTDVLYNHSISVVYSRLIPAVHSHYDLIGMCEHVANHLKFHSIKIGLQTLIPTAQSLAQLSYSYLIVTIIHSIHLSRSGSYTIWINFSSNGHENIYKKGFEKESTSQIRIHKYLSLTDWKFFWQTKFQAKKLVSLL